MLDENGKVDHNKVYFDPNSFINEPKIFNELPLDYTSCELDPKENPLNIQHALLNRGEYPAEYSAQRERFVEDCNNRVKPIDKVWKTIVHMTNLVPEDRKMIKQNTNKFKLRQCLDDLKYSGKPFYWVDHEKLKQLKSVCEQQKDPGMRKEAFAVLNEFKAIVEKYN